jgi:crotonobetainyl-CoA:carnitine CoA-transferase CaiB-like acyl-CoA transferase
MRQALSDIRVIEIGTGVAASWCGKAFADLGADVIKVEPPTGDALRADAGMFAHLNTNKRSTVIEMAPVAAPMVRDLIADADLVIETPGTAELRHWDITREDVFERHPAMCIVAITGFGATGPYAGYAWSDLVTQAFAGTLVRDRRGPVRLPMSIGECTVGHTAAEGALAAILRARATGVGALVDCAAAEALAANPTRIALHLGWEYRGREDLAQRALDSSSILLPNGVHPCADGYVALMMTTQQLKEMLTVLDSPELTEAFSRPDAFARPETKEILDGVLYPWLLSRTRQQITEAGQSVGWPVAPVHRPEELLTADHLHQRGFWVHGVDPEIGPVLMPGAPYRHAEGGWRLRHAAPKLGQLSFRSDPVERSEPAPAAVARDPDVPPLRGLRVLDLTTVWSGPLLTLHLADLGAEVIRIESPQVFPPTTRGLQPRPDPAMLLSVLVGGYGPAVEGRADRPYNRHSMYNSVNRGKRSCTLDVRQPEQRELFMRLVAVSDVFVENLKMSTLHQVGIYETELLTVNPRLIVLRLPPAGLTGDWAHYTGFGGQFDGLTGLASLCGHAGTELFETPTTQYMDTATGPAGAFALLAGLHYRAATGRGQVIELAQSENVLAQLGDVFVNLQLGEEPVRHGNRDRHRAPQGLYPCADDRLIALTIPDDESWQALTGVLGRADLTKDARLEGSEGRLRAHDQLDEAITEWTSKLSALDAFHELQAAGIAAAPVLDERSFTGDPQVVSREWIRPLANRDVGSFNHFGHSFRGIPMAWERGAPTLGEDNEYVMREILGLDATAYDRLIQDHVAVEDYLDSRGNPC